MSRIRNIARVGSCVLLRRAVSRGRGREQRELRASGRLCCRMGGTWICLSWRKMSREVSRCVM